MDFMFRAEESEPGLSRFSRLSETIAATVPPIARVTTGRLTLVRGGIERLSSTTANGGGIDIVFV